MTGQTVTPVMAEPFPSSAFQERGVLEPHFTPAQIAKAWGLSASKVRRIFEREPGVLRIGEPSRRLGRKLKRRYFTMRIPQTVARRVHARLCQTRSLIHAT